MKNKEKPRTRNAYNKYIRHVFVVRNEDDDDDDDDADDDGRRRRRY